MQSPGLIVNGCELVVQSPANGCTTDGFLLWLTNLVLKSLIAIDAVGCLDGPGIALDV